MQFDISDVEPVKLTRSRAPTEVTPIEEDDMLEAACMLPLRVGAGTTPPSLAEHVFRSALRRS